MLSANASYISLLIENTIQNGPGYLHSNICSRSINIRVVNWRIGCQVASSYTLPSQLFGLIKGIVHELKSRDN